MEKPDWKQTAQTLLPLLTAAGAVTALAFVPHSTGLPGDIQNVIVNLGANLAAGGLGALCRPSRLRAAKEHRETLANHDIRQMIKTAWGDAALASLQDYCEARPTCRPPSIVTSGVSAKFRKVECAR